MSKIIKKQFKTNNRWKNSNSEFPPYIPGFLIQIIYKEIGGNYTFAIVYCAEREKDEDRLITYLSVGDDFIIDNIIEVTNREIHGNDIPNFYWRPFPFGGLSAPIHNYIISLMHSKELDYDDERYG